MSIRLPLMVALFLFATNLVAGDDKSVYVMNFDIDLSDAATSQVLGSLQLQGIHLQEGKPFEGTDLGNFDYFFTVTETDSGEARLMIEFYQYETRKKLVIASNIIAKAGIQFGQPGEIKLRNSQIFVDLAFSINRK